MKKRKKKSEKAAADDGDDILILCLLTSENKMEKVKKKVRFMENIKMPMKACMLCTIYGENFHSFTKNMWISDALCHIANDDTSLFDVTNIDKSVQGILGNMPTMKKLHINVHQVNGNDGLHTLWPIKFCP